MAKLVDALVSGTSFRKDVQVRVLFWAPKDDDVMCRLPARLTEVIRLGRYPESYRDFSGIRICNIYSLKSIVLILGIKSFLTLKFK
jgi:hypothetical protein